MQSLMQFLHRSLRAVLVHVHLVLLNRRLSRSGAPLRQGVESNWGIRRRQR